MATSGSKMAGRLTMAVACFVLLLSVGTAAAMEPHNKGKITVYWGQNAMEGSLRQACESNLYSTVIISFLTYSNGGKYFKLNLAGHPWHAVGNDIKYCQSRSILVLLAITEEGGKYSVPSKNEAIELGKHVWDNYLGGRSPHRPFGDAMLNGVDFYDIKVGDFDKNKKDDDPMKHHDDDPNKQDHSKHYDDLARYLKNYSKEKRKVWITASPQCLPFPDHPMIGDVLRSGIIDRVHVLFYNNPFCSYRFDNEGAFTQAWNKWASSLPKSSVYLGLPASPHAAWTGYIEPDTLESKVLPIVQRSHNYGGIALWNRFWDLQTGYSKAVSNAL